MKKIILAAAWLIMGHTLSFAQEQKKPANDSFKPGWFIGANLGVNTFYGEGNNFITPNNPHYFSVIKNSSFLGRAELGYKFTPVIGLRGFLGYMQTNWPDIRLTQNTDGSYPAVKFGSEKLTADLMVNLSNWWAGYNPERKVDISVFAGGGAAYLNNNTLTGSNFAAIGRGGIQGDYHLSPVLDLNLIAEANIAGDNYNDYIINPLPYDAFSAITVGVTYRLPAAEKKAVKTTDVQPVAQKPDSTIKPVAPEPAAIAKTETKPVQEAVDSTEAEEPVTPKTVLTGLNEKIFFAVNKATIVNSKQEESLAIIAGFLKQHPEATITINGYADKSTGTVEENNEMSKQRAVTVANTLIRRYGIDIKRIRVMWYGGGVQPFRYAPKNRLVIVKSPFTYTTTVVTPASTGSVKTSARVATPVVETKQLSAPTDEKDIFVTVNFLQSKFDIDDAKQEEAIKKVADYLKRNPDANIVVSGYADKTSGSSEKNDELSKKRAVSVANTLIKKYEIAIDRIQVKWFGAKKQPNTNPTMNRLVLIETLR